jgi:hypothetical protein
MIFCISFRSFIASEDRKRLLKQALNKYNFRF